MNWTTLSAVEEDLVLLVLKINICLSWIIFYNFFMDINFDLILEEAKKKINECSNINTLLHDVKSFVLGKNSELVKLLSNMKSLSSSEDKKTFGASINNIKTKIEELLNNKRTELEQVELNKQFETESLDGTLPYRQLSEGSLHLITKTEQELCNIFTKYGFVLTDGYEIEEDYYNFTALNVQKNHPARQMQDTFYLNSKSEDGNNYLLRTHTTCVDARTIIENGLQPPIALISYGKTFRVDSDWKHSPMFHQFEGLAIDENLSLGNLKYFLEKMLKEFFETNDVVLRMRPSYFPFTEPSVEVDVGYSIINNRIKIGGSGNFLEVLGAGMLHPNVLKNMNIDSKKYTAIAFGCGIERFAMLKYDAHDIRQFSASKINWLKHYSFGNFEV